MPGHPEILFKYMHDNGYKVLYQEDMCYKGGWGLNDELDASGDWQLLKQKIENVSYIDDLGEYKFFYIFDIHSHLEKTYLAVQRLITS